MYLLTLNNPTSLRGFPARSLRQNTHFFSQQPVETAPCSTARWKGAPHSAKFAWLTRLQDDLQLQERNYTVLQSIQFIGIVNPCPLSDMFISNICPNNSMPKHKRDIISAKGNLCLPKSEKTGLLLTRKIFFQGITIFHQ